MHCTNCGAPIDGLKFCGRCGRAATPQPPAAKPASGKQALVGCLAVLGVVAVVIMISSAIYKSERGDDTPPAVDVAAADLIELYEQNAIAADQRFKGRRVAVRGTVTGIGREILGNPYVIIEGGIQAVFDKKYESRVANMRVGAGTTAGCEVSGKLLYVQLRNCQ